MNNMYKIQVSPDAVIQIKNQLEKRGTPNSSIRLGIKGSGCHGFSYVLQYEDDPPRKKDLLFDIDGIKVVVDIKSILYLNNSILDWEKTLMYQGFKFKNPNEASKCGCGTSFTV